MTNNCMSTYAYCIVDIQTKSLDKFVHNKRITPPCDHYIVTYVTRNIDIDRLQDMT